MVIILNKAQMYAALESGQFGNTAVHYSSAAEAIASNPDGCFAIRCKLRNHPVFIHSEPAATLEARIRLLLSQNSKLRLSDLQIVKPLPEDKRTIQGELSWDERGLCLFYSYFPAHMRIALQTDGKSVSGLTAHNLLRYHLDPCDYEHLLSLTQDYPGHAVEFTGFRVPVGRLHRRMVIWEIRLYTWLLPLFSLFF